MILVAKLREQARFACGRRHVRVHSIRMVLQGLGQMRAGAGCVSSVEQEPVLHQRCAHNVVMGTFSTSVVRPVSNSKQLKLHLQKGFMRYHTSA